MPQQRLRDLFLDKQLPKFQRLAEYMKEETLYKFLWSFVKSGRLVSEGDALVWNHVRFILQKRAQDFSPNIMTNIMVLSTQAKKFEEAAAASGDLDFWGAMEPRVIVNMKEMSLEDLINLMWASMQVRKGSEIFF